MGVKWAANSECFNDRRGFQRRALNHDDGDGRSHSPWKRDKCDRRRSDRTRVKLQRRQQRLNFYSRFDAGMQYAFNDSEFIYRVYGGLYVADNDWRGWKCAT